MTRMMARIRSAMVIIIAIIIIIIAMIIMMALILMRGCEINMGAGIPSLLWPATHFYIINRSTSGEHLRDQLRQSINPLSFSTIVAIIAIP